MTTRISPSRLAEVFPGLGSLRSCIEVVHGIILTESFLQNDATQVREGSDTCLLIQKGPTASMAIPRYERCASSTRSPRPPHRGTDSTRSHHRARDRHPEASTVRVVNTEPATTVPLRGQYASSTPHSRARSRGTDGARCQHGARDWQVAVAGSRGAPLRPPSPSRGHGQCSPSN